MNLAAGTRLGPYEILAPIGAGGMGEVYRACDTRLNRTVAIKTIKGDFSERLEREARTVANLNHPNICALYDVGPDFLVMEYIEGHTLASLIAKRGLHIRDALRIASQVADGLSRAHAAGVIHRDLKPANIMVTTDGTAKILDFGIARVACAQAADGETQTATAEGTLVGTVAYMSPEQVEGRKLDTRSDIFSFGTVLYELITGTRAFRGDSSVSTLAAILHTEPKSWDGVPPQVEPIIRRCLRKDPERRWQTAADLKIVLDDARDEVITGGFAAPSGLARPKRNWILPASIALALAACTALAGWWWASRAPAALGPRLVRLTSDSGLTTDPAISSDGKLVAYASDRAGEGGTDIWVQQTAGGEPIRITRDPANDLQPSFSPDSSRIVFRSDRDGGGIYTVSALGGEDHLVARHGHNPRYSPDGQWIAYRIGEEGGTGGRRMIAVVPAAGGAARELPMPVTGVYAPVWAPDNKAILVNGFNPTRGQPEQCLLPIAGGPPACSVSVGFFRRGWSPFAWLGPELYFTAGTGDVDDVYRVRIASDGSIRGAPERLTTGTAQETRATVRLMDGNPQMIFAGLNQNADIWILNLDASGAALLGEPVRLTSSPAMEFRVFPLSDPNKVGYLRQTSPRSTELCIRDLRTGRDSAIWRNPSITMSCNSDASKIAYMQNSKIYVVSPGDPVPQEVSDQRGRPDDWTRDGRYILLSPYEAIGSSANTHRMRLVDVIKQQTIVMAEHPKWILHPGVFSADNRWVSFFATNSAVTRQIFVSPVRTSGLVPQEDWIAVTDGKFLDREPRWSSDGNTIYFLSERDGFRCLWAQRLDSGTKKPRGDAFAVFHGHSARLSLNVGTDTHLNGLTVDGNKIYVTMAESTGNLWLASW